MAQTENSPATNQQLFDIGKIMIHNSGCFNQDLRTWESKDAGDLTWENFQTHFSEAQQELELSQPTDSAMRFNQSNIARETAKIVTENFKQAPLIQEYPSYYEKILKLML